jgi:polyphenol oxidase
MDFLHATWPAPKHIRALTTTRTADLLTLKNTLHLPQEPTWLTQTHSNTCVRIETNPLREADASVTQSPMHPLAIKTADCLPIVLCNQAGTAIAAIHAGWRGLLDGIIENTLSTMNAAPNTLMAWTGPAICERCFEVGPEVPRAFIKRYPYVASAFRPHHNKSLGSLPGIAELILKQHGVQHIYHSNACTFEEENKFYSYRRDKQTGRLATLIWFQDIK